jgi:hypothetical protein
VTFTFSPTQGDNIEPGIYPARLVSVDEKDSKDGDTFRVWTFKAKVGNDVIEITGASSLSNATNSKAYAWITAILGRELNVNESVTLDDLKSKTVNLIVKKDANGFGKIESLATFHATPAPVAPPTDDDLADIA